MEEKLKKNNFIQENWFFSWLTSYWVWDFVGKGHWLRIWTVILEGGAYCVLGAY